MLLNIYIGSVIISLFVLYFTSVTFSKRMKREGYKSKIKESFVECLYSTVKNVLQMSIPVFNIVVAIGILFMDDKKYEELRDKLLMEGKIVYDPENETNELETEENNKNESCFTKKYEKMSIREKLNELELERQRIINYMNSNKNTDVKTYNKTLNNKFNKN